MTVERPWVAALLLGSVITPAAVILAIPAPWPLDAVLAWPLVLLDRWMGPGGAPLARVAAGIGGIGLTWGHYVVLGRVLVWWVGRREG